MSWDNDYIATLNGNKFWPLTGKGKLDIHEIAHALGMICRFNGHVMKFLSVAEHCVLVSKIVPEEYAFDGLMHDAAEAYLTDLPRPVKRSLPGYSEAEARIERRISQEFGAVFPLSPEVKAADNEALLIEAVTLMAFDFEADGYGTPETQNPQNYIYNWAPHEAKMAFINRYDKLKRV